MQYRNIYMAKGKANTKWEFKKNMNIKLPKGHELNTESSSIVLFANSNSNWNCHLDSIKKYLQNEGVYCLARIKKVSFNSSF